MGYTSNPRSFESNSMNIPLSGVQVLGDVHAGKRFINDVPLHRRGERERMILIQLQEELDVGPNVNVHVQVGDLFDAFEVPNAVVLQVANLYIQAKLEHPNVQYVVYRGNHDASRDTAKVSSFDIFAAIVDQFVTVLTEPTIGTFGGHIIGFMPWHPFKSAKELAEELLKQKTDLKHEEKLDAVFAHCDFESFGGNDYNVLPYETLKILTSQVVSGHVHLKEKFERNGVQITGTGSMAPYSYSEDPEGLLYITLDFDEFQATPKILFENKYVRVRLKKGQEIPEIPNCLGFKTVLVGDDNSETEDADISMEIQDFNTRDIFVSCLVEKEVSATVQAEVLAQFDSQV